MNPLDFATMHEFRMLLDRVAALEAKAKEPEIVFRSGGSDDPPKPWESDRIPREQREHGWRAREMESGYWGAGAVEIHPRAVRVRQHKMNGVWLGPCAYPNDCKLEHAEFLQISSEPAGGPK
jgi:hypothetical protein